MTRFGRYETLEVLGRGGMAIVYRAFDTTTEREVAVKVLSSHLVAPGADATLQARFEREIKLAARLEHPHLAGVLDVGVEGEQPYIIMRLFKGGSLQDRLRFGPLSVAETVRIVQEVAAALDEAHRQGIVHRDIKPSNLLFDQQGMAYVSDFGVARLMDAADPLTVSAGVVGTPAYMSPEQLKGLPLTGRSDQYALCLVAFQSLTARLPFEGTTAQMILQHLQEPLPSIRRYNGGLSLAFERVLARAAAKDPAARYVTCSEFAAALATAAAEAPPLAAAAGSGPHTEPDMALATPLPPTRLPVMAAALAEARAAAAAEADLARPPAPAAPGSPRSARRAWPVYALLAAGLVLAISLGWQWLSAASPTLIATTPAPAATQTMAASATLAPTNTADATAAASGMVTLDPEAEGLAVVALPPGLAAAAVYDAPQGTVIATVPDRSIVQVLRGREVTPDGVVWVEVKLLTGERGWMVESLLSYIRGASPTPQAATVAPTNTLPAATTTTSRAGVIHTATATRRPGERTATPPPTGVVPAATQPRAGETPAVTNPAPSTVTPVPPTATALPPTLTVAPPTHTLAPPSPLAPTDTPPPPAPTNTPGVVCTLLPILCP